MVEQVFERGIRVADETPALVGYVEVYSPDDGVVLVLLRLGMDFLSVYSIEHVLPDSLSQVMRPCHTCENRKHTCL